MLTQHMLTQRPSPADTTLRLTGQDFTAAFKNNFIAFVVPIATSNSNCTLHSRIEIPSTSPRPPQTLAAQFKRPYRNCPDPTDLRIPAFLLRGSPDTDLSFLVTNPTNR